MLPTSQMPPKKALPSRLRWWFIFQHLRLRQFKIAFFRSLRALVRAIPLSVLFFVRYLWSFLFLSIVFYICWALASHNIAGLTPDQLARLQFRHDPPPPESHLKVTLIPPLATWEMQPDNSPRQEIDFDIENDGDQPGSLSAALLPTPSACAGIDPPTDSATPPGLPQTALDPQKISVSPHQIRLLVFPIHPINNPACSLPSRIAFTFHYTWSLDPLRGRKGHTLTQSPKTEVIETPPLPAAAANPVQLNLAVQLPPQARYSRAVPGQPERHYSGTITTAPILVTTASAASIHRLLTLGSSLASKFTWPILIAFLTIVGQNALARRSERQQIHTDRLNALTSLMQRHYLSITRRIATVVLESEPLPTLCQDLQNAGQAVPANPAAISDATNALNFQVERVFTAVLLMRKRILRLVESKGGVFFPSPLAEDIFRDGFSRFYSYFKTATGESDHCESLAASLELEAQLHVAQAGLFARPLTASTQNAIGGFTAWIEASGTPHDFDRFCILLDLCQAVMLFEYDRVQYEAHASALGDSFDPPLFEFTSDLDNLPAFVEPGTPPGTDLERREYLTWCARYFQGIAEECRPGLLYPTPK